MARFDASPEEANRVYARFSEKEQQVYDLIILGGYTEAKAATLLSLNEKTVQIFLRRTHEKLRQSFPSSPDEGLNVPVSSPRSPRHPDASSEAKVEIAETGITLRSA
jgi:DNA-binding CsgD family transcriptional regulator